MRATGVTLALVLLTLAVACKGGGQASPSPAPTVGVTPTVTASVTPTVAPSPAAVPAVLAGKEIVPLEFGPEADMPEDTALILETGCMQCDGPTTGFIRVYRDASGKVRVDPLLAMDAPWLPRRIVTTKEGTLSQEAPSITGFAISQDASEMVVSVCVKASCGSGGMEGWSPGSLTKLLRSTDGGVTWREMGELEIGGFVVALMSQGRVLVGTWEQENGPAVFRTFPGLERVQSPGPTTQMWPRFVYEGEVIWQAWEQGQLLRGDGSVFLDLGPGGWISGSPVAVTGTAGFGLSWSYSPEASLSRNFLSILAGDDLTETFSAPGFLLLGAHASKIGVFVGNTGIAAERLSTPLPTGRYFLGILPALIDVKTRQVRPLTDPFLREDWTGGRSIVHAVQIGPLARIAGAGGCLNVRAEPGMSGRVLVCAADGVLLRETGESRTVDGAAWVPVVTPAGTEGWASAAFLER